MEHGIQNQYNFSIELLRTELNRTERLLKYISKGEYNIRLKKKRTVLNLAILKLKGQVVDWEEFSYPITILRQNINWLSKQVSVVPSSQKLIEEIELASNLLTTKNGKD